MLKILLAIVVALLVVLIAMPASAGGGIGLSVIEYQYDSVHEVGIWTVKMEGGGGIFVLPAGQFKNPTEGMKER